MLKIMLFRLILIPRLLHTPEEQIFIQWPRAHTKSRYFSEVSWAVKFQNFKKEKAHLNYITALMIKKNPKKQSPPPKKTQTTPSKTNKNSPPKKTKKAFQLCRVYNAKQWETEVAEMFL